jgi:hypothetical protein
MKAAVSALLLLVAFAALPALAQDDSSSLEIPLPPYSTVPPELQGVLGDWLLEQDDPNLPTCPIALTDTVAPCGWAVAVTAECPPPYPAPAALSVWNVDLSDGSVRLMDADGHTTLRLLEDEDGLYDTGPDAQPHFYLLPPSDQNGAAGEADD